MTPHLRNVRAAVLTVGGWFDAEDLSGTLKTYRATELQNPGIPERPRHGPLVPRRLAWRRRRPARSGPLPRQDRRVLPRRGGDPVFGFLLGETNAAFVEATVFETGTGRWRRESAWPPTNAVARTLHFHPAGRLDFGPPTDPGAGFDEYVSDPANPVPFTEHVTTGMPADYMVADQRFAARRPDVLVYQTDPLPEDVTMAGPIEPSSASRPPAPIPTGS